MKSKKYIWTMLFILMAFIAFRVYQNGLETFSDPMTLIFIIGIIFDLFIISWIIYFIQKYRKKSESK